MDLFSFLLISLQVLSTCVNVTKLWTSFDGANNVLSVSEQHSEKVSHPSSPEPPNTATLLDGRHEGKFVSPNIVNLSRRYLFKDQTSLLSKGLIFIPTPWIH